MLENFLYLTRIGLDTHHEPIVYMRADCDVCKAEGFSAHSRVRVTCGDNSIIATLGVVTAEWLSRQNAGLSEAAWRLLGANEGDKVYLSHPKPVESMSHVRGKLYGKTLNDETALKIIEDINHGRYSNIQLAAYVTACAGSRLSPEETLAITKAMVETGRRFQWDRELIVDKHCVGGVPGNRTTPIVTSIVAANGLVMPKTSSRAITSPAGTADMMECVTNVTLSFEHMRRVVEDQGACLAWGGSVALSPTDDIIIRVERALDLDSEGQLVASIISKKIAAGSTHVLIDIPVGPTAKVRNREIAQRLSNTLVHTGEALGLVVEPLISDGTQPIGRGIGPMLEAVDVMAVLKNDVHAPQDLRERALVLASRMLELGGLCTKGLGYALAKQTLDCGKAYEKFRAICEAQGGMKEIRMATYTKDLLAESSGIVTFFDNRILSRAAGLAGAPGDSASGLSVHVSAGDMVEKGEPILTIYSESPGELDYALTYLKEHPEIVRIEASAV